MIFIKFSTSFLSREAFSISPFFHIKRTFFSKKTKYASLGLSVTKKSITFACSILYAGDSICLGYENTVINTSHCMNIHGLILGAGAFLCIGIFHPLVIKAEYWFGVRSWWAFLAVGLAAAIGSLFVENIYVSIFLGIFAFSALWGIGEVFKQRERVRKGWFPMNPKRKDDYQEPDKDK